MNKTELSFFNTPEYVYIKYDDINKLKLRKNGMIYYGENIGILNNGDSIYSNCSGIIKGSKKVLEEDKMVDVLVIENDYKNKYFKFPTGKSVFNDYKRKDANLIFESFNIEGKFNGKKYLMINMILKNNNQENKYIANEYAYELLETIDAMLTIFSLTTAYIAVNDNEIENALKKYSGIYPNIKFTNRAVNNEYGVIYNGYDVIRIYNALKFNKTTNEKYVTFIDKREIKVIKTKINVLMEDILKYLNIENKNISVVTYNDEVINDYNGLLTYNVKSIKVM